MASVFTKFYQNSKGVVSGKTEPQTLGSTMDYMDFELLISDQSIDQFGYLQPTKRIFYNNPNTGQKYPVYCNCLDSKVDISQCPHLTNVRIQQLLFSKYKHRETVMSELAKNVKKEDMDSLCFMMNRIKHNCDDFSLINLRELCTQTLTSTEVDDIISHKLEKVDEINVKEEDNNKIPTSCEEISFKCKDSSSSSSSSSHTSSTSSEFKESLLPLYLNSKPLLYGNKGSKDKSIKRREKDSLLDMNRSKESDYRIEDEKIKKVEKSNSDELDVAEESLMFEGKGKLNGNSSQGVGNTNKDKLKKKKKPLTKAYNTKKSAKRLEQIKESTIKLLNIYFIETIRFSNEINRELIKIISQEPCNKCKGFFETLKNNNIHNYGSAICKFSGKVGCSQCVGCCHIIASIIEDYKMMEMFSDENSRASLAAAYCLTNRYKFIELPQINFNMKLNNTSQIESVKNNDTSKKDEKLLIRNPLGLPLVANRKGCQIDVDQSENDNSELIYNGLDLSQGFPSTRHSVELNLSNEETNPLTNNNQKLQSILFVPKSGVQYGQKKEKLSNINNEDNYTNQQETQDDKLCKIIENNIIDLKLLTQVLSGIGLINREEFDHNHSKNSEDEHSNKIIVTHIVSKRKVLNGKVLPKVFQQTRNDQDKDGRKKDISSSPLVPGSKIIGICVKLSFCCNILLAVLKLVALILSNSMIMIASFLDSILDILSGLVLVVSDAIAKKHNSNDSTKYPIGKQRIHTIGFLVFSCVMATFTIEIIISAITTLVSGSSSVDFGVWPISILVVTVFLKLILWIMCHIVGKKYDSDACKAYSQDHRNDVLSNVVGLGFGIMTKYLAWWLDSTGSILISLYILINWVITAFGLIKILLGQSASKKFLSTIIFVASNFSEEILAVDFVEAFHSGKQVIVELHVVLPREMSLERSHDIGEALQNHIETLDKVERCFVHVDVDSIHKNEKKRGTD